MEGQSEIEEQIKENPKLRIAIIHPDLGIGGGERLIVDAAVELAAHGHNVHVFTAHHDKSHCFEETLGVSAVVPIMRIKRLAKIVFYCHFPDLLLAQHSTLLRRIYRKPFDLLEEATTANLLLPLLQIHSNPFILRAYVQLFSIQQSMWSSSVSLSHIGGYDKRLVENVEYLEALKSLAVREGIADRVEFITSCSTAQRNKLLSECLCVIYTPKDEHFGIVPLEAMAAQKPVIACNSGGPLETIKHAATGFLCEPTPQQFSSAMAALMRNPEMAVEMGKQARDHVTQMFSTKSFGQRLNQYVVELHEKV